MPSSTAPLPANVLDALQRGDKIEAIKMLRESSGVGLKEAKDAIDQHLRGTADSAVKAASESSLPFAVAEAMRQGQKIEAIRLLREQTGLGLKDAKDAVDAFQRHTQAGDGLGPASGGSKTRMVAWVVFVVIALVVYYLLRRPG